MSSSIIWFFIVESFQCASDFKLLRFDDPISLQGRHFRFCLRGPTAQSSLNLLLPSTPPKNDIISGCRPLCRQIFDDLSFILIIHSILIFLTFDSLKGNAPSLPPHTGPNGTSVIWWELISYLGSGHNAAEPEAPPRNTSLVNFRKNMKPFKEVCLLTGIEGFHLCYQ